MAEKEYTRLTGARQRGSQALTRSSLWLGKDHLLSIDSTGYNEEYKRFYFRDIQAITIAVSLRRRLWNWVFGALAGLCLVGWGYVVAGSTDVGFIVFNSMISFLVGTPLLLNNLLGPTCTCHLRTAVQTEELPSLSRVRRVRRVLKRIRPLIVAAQGQLTPEEVSARMRELSQSLAQGQAAPAGQPTSPEPSRYVIDDLNAPPRIIS